ncbi:hypothetical protein CLIB1444_08S05798 [[Candida] jaroonii]|uniref:Uncharacterized protein n=1 Tax=[Candida] jaroonii TaxID=467808 RepID=A0ACA9YBY0_9ASCO|nr:hypothetical protein CLIB1444_08S05798 [[Candida] jaroonii]
MMYKKKIDSLILNYFIQEGYKDAAIMFSKETNIDLIDKTGQLSSPSTKSNEFLQKLKAIDDNSALLKLIEDYKFEGESKVYDKNVKTVKGYSTINERREIKYLILKGEITKAIEKISEYFPMVLDSNNLLHFKLLRLNVIEMIRNHKLENPSSSNDIEKQFLNDILLFVRQNLINKVTKSFKLLRELEITMSLLCFNFDPSLGSIDEQKDLPEELRSLFDLSLRSQCYKLVNRAILDLNKEYEFDDYPESLENDQKYFDKINYSNDTNFNMEDLDMDEIREYNDSNDEEIDINEIIEGASKKDESNDESNDEGNLKLQELALESKLERLVKLWSVTESRISNWKYLSNDKKHV